MKQSSFDATISARRRGLMWRRLRLWQRRRRSRIGHSIRRYRHSMRRRRRSMRRRWRSARETSALGAGDVGARRGRRRRSARRRLRSRGVTGDIGDCGVGITPQMSNRVTDHGDMSTFSKPASVWVISSIFLSKTCFKVISMIKMVILD